MATPLSTENWERYTRSIIDTFKENGFEMPVKVNGWFVFHGENVKQTPVPAARVDIEYTHKTDDPEHDIAEALADFVETALKKNVFENFGEWLDANGIQGANFRNIWFGLGVKVPGSTHGNINFENNGMEYKLDYKCMEDFKNEVEQHTIKV